MGDADSIADGKDVEKIQKRNDRLAKGGMGADVIKALDERIGTVSTWEDNDTNKDKLKKLTAERERMTTSMGLESKNPMEVLGNRIIQILEKISIK